jgi:hypothetical protein
MRLSRYIDSKDKPIGWAHWCPACRQIHVFNVEQPTRAYPEFNIKGGVRWTFDGNLEQPTFAPSMLISTGGWKRPDGSTVQRRTVCHYHLQGGVLKYCADSPHALAGKNVALPEIPGDQVTPA